MASVARVRREGQAVGDLGAAGAVRRRLRPLRALVRRRAMGTTRASDRSAGGRLRSTGGSRRRRHAASGLAGFPRRSVGHLLRALRRRLLVARAAALDLRRQRLGAGRRRRLEGERPRVLGHLRARRLRRGRSRGARRKAGSGRSPSPPPTSSRRGRRSRSTRRTGSGWRTRSATEGGARTTEG